MKSQYRGALAEVTPKQRKYFLWKNKLKDRKHDYSKISKEDLCKEFDMPNLIYYEEWESTEQYKNLLKLLMQENTLKDLIDIYNVVKEKALTGDDKAVKTFLILQKEFNKKSAKKIVENDGNNDDEPDDGLTLE